MLKNLIQMSIAFHILVKIEMKILENYYSMLTEFEAIKVLNNSV